MIVERQIMCWTVTQREKMIKKKIRAENIFCNTSDSKQRRFRQSFCNRHSFDVHVFVLVRNSCRRTLLSRLSGVDHVYLSQMQSFPLHNNYTPRLGCLCRGILIHLSVNNALFIPPFTRTAYKALFVYK